MGKGGGGEGRGVNKRSLRELEACDSYLTGSVKADRMAEPGKSWTSWSGRYVFLCKR